MAQKDPVRNGEMYRIIADTGGAFVQPALYEAFGLTVVEVGYLFSQYILNLCILLYFVKYTSAQRTVISGHSI